MTRRISARRSLLAIAAAIGLVVPVSVVAPVGRALAEDTALVSTDFENGLDGWVARPSQGKPTVALTTDESHSASHAALVSGRSGQGDGIGHEMTGLMQVGKKYNISAWVKFAPGNPAASIWLTMRRTKDGSDTFDTIAQFADVPGDSWLEVTASYTLAEADKAFIYFETAYPDGTKASFLIDDIVIGPEVAASIQKDLKGVKETVTFPLGVAIDSRETMAAYSELVVKHFNQITPENHMKPEAWYDSGKTFRINPEAKTLMAYAKANGLRVWGHTLLWHQQTPPWFFQRDDGTPLTNSDADKTILRNRLHDHIFNIAKTLSDLYGPFGSDTNPLVGFDTVNEVISDGSSEADGLRRSTWYNVLGDEYITDAFKWADEAFNVKYAATGVTRPVKLAINDYNTDQQAKRTRLHNLVKKLLDAKVPVDIVGHQFHVSLSTNPQALDDTLKAFEDLPVKQDVSELDVLTGTPIDNAKLIDQGYFYRDAFRIFRAHAKSLFSVTIWGAYDARSWHSDNFPLLFTDKLQAKPAYYGAIDAKLDPRVRTANVFQAAVALDGKATTLAEWQHLPLISFSDAKKGGFAVRWADGHLSVYAKVNDAKVDPGDALGFKVGDKSYTFKRDKTGDLKGEVAEVSGGWTAVVQIPMDDAKAGAKVQFDVTVTDGSATTGWNDAGAIGTLTLVEPVSFVQVAQTDTAPTIDGVVDEAWAKATAVSTGKQVTGSDSASATVKTLWKGNVLYVLMQVKDANLDATASDPWEQDSVEIYVDNQNAKSPTYRADDTQIRINYKNVTSFGTGDENAQKARLTSATKTVDGGYVVEAAIDLLGGGGANTYIGLDFQVNDGTGGKREGIRNWADATNAGYLSPSHWGVALLYSASSPSGSDSGDSGGLPVALIVVAVVALAAIACGVLFVGLRLRRKRVAA